MSLSYAERTPKSCWIHVGDEDMEGEIRARGAKYRAEIIAASAGATKARSANRVELQIS